MILMILGDNFRLLGQIPKAAQFYERSGDMAREIGNRRSLCFALAELGWLRQIDGRDEEAEEIIGEALELSRELGIKTVKATVLETYGIIMFSQDRLDKAESAYKEAQLLFEDDADTNRVLDAKAGLAGVLLERGAVDEAFEQVIEIVERLANGDLLTGAKAPDQISLLCVKVLLAKHDPRSKRILEQSYNNLLSHAAKLNDEESRRAFIGNVPWRQEIEALRQAQQS